MKIRKAEFIKSAVKPEGYPRHTMPEIAFAGRSNVGKSSLINTITGRKGLVKVSKTPGKTQLLNFFTLNDELAFVDMPGYGFAAVPDSVKKSWGAMVETYLKTGKNLKGVIALLDARRNPNDDDLSLLDWLAHYKVPTVIVFTKIDKIPRTRRPGFVKKALAKIEGHVLQGVEVIQFSSLTGDGKRALWKAILRLAGLAPDHQMTSKGLSDNPST